MTTDLPSSEQAIEDILAQSPHIIAPLLDVEATELVQVARQQSLPTGRTDLVYLAGDEVILIELKVVEATTVHVDQLAGYVTDYQDEASRPVFATGRDLRPVLMAPEIPQDIKQSCVAEGFTPVEYDIKSVLDEYQETLFADLAQFQVTGIVTSVARLGLLNKYLRYLDNATGAVSTTTAADQYAQIGKGKSTAPEGRVQMFQKAASRLALIQLTSDGAVLTERGEQYVDAGDPAHNPWQVTAGRADVVVEFLYDEPFYSDPTFSLIALVDSVFELSKNQHPVPREQLQDWYASKVGKENSWGERTRTDVVRWLGSYLEELGLAAVVNRQFYLTPDGFSLLSHVHIDEGKAMIRSQR